MITCRSYTTFFLLLFISFFSFISSAKAKYLIELTTKKSRITKQYILLKIQKKSMEVATIRKKNIKKYINFSEIDNIYINTNNLNYAAICTEPYPESIKQLQAIVNFFEPAKNLSFVGENPYYRAKFYLYKQTLRAKEFTAIPQQQYQAKSLATWINNLPFKMEQDEAKLFPIHLFTINKKWASARNAIKRLTKSKFPLLQAQYYYLLAHIDLSRNSQQISVLENLNHALFLSLGKDNYLTAHIIYDIMTYYQNTKKPLTSLQKSEIAHLLTIYKLYQLSTYLKIPRKYKNLAK